MQPRFMGMGVECPDRLSLFCPTASPHSTRVTMYSSTSLIFSLLLLTVGGGNFQSAGISTEHGQWDTIPSAGSVRPGSYCSTNVYGFCRELDDAVGRTKTLNLAVMLRLCFLFLSAGSLLCTKHAEHRQRLQDLALDWGATLSSPLS